MAKKGKNSVMLNVSPRNREKLRLACRSFDRKVLTLVLILLLCVWIGSSGELQLSKPAPHGFALWFVVFPSYWLLLIANGIQEIFGLSLDLTGFKIIFCGVCDLLLIGGVWLWVRFSAADRGVVWVRDAGLFVTIMNYWGFFQLGCTLVAYLCRLKA